MTPGPGVGSDQFSFIASQFFLNGTKLVLPFGHLCTLPFELHFRVINDPAPRIACCKGLIQIRGADPGVLPARCSQVITLLRGAILPQSIQPPLFIALEIRGDPMSGAILAVAADP